MGKDATDIVFERLVRQLEDWHADDVKARAYDTGGSPAEAGHAILHRRRYPGPNWRRAWSDPHADRRAILLDLEDEIYGLSHSPSQASPASGHHRGTTEWRQAVADADGSLRAVARRFGISHTEVRRIRMDMEVSP